MNKQFNDPSVEVLTSTENQQIIVVESESGKVSRAPFTLIPPPPTLVELGGEPAGAETRAKTYTDSQISQLPPPPTLVELGGEPAGAETRAKTYTDGKTNPALNWVQPALSNNWVNIGEAFGFPHLKYCLNSLTKLVTIRGSIRNGTTNGGTLFTLPSDCWPKFFVAGRIISPDSLARITVGANGNVNLITANNTEVHILFIFPTY